ncbi:hypothetical protein NL676_034678 [Syzygium grande]|nr:hypothetical protein NL676_034678 [Syzygium grande]
MNITLFSPSSLRRLRHYRPPPRLRFAARSRSLPRPGLTSSPQDHARFPGPGLTDPRVLSYFAANERQRSRSCCGLAGGSSRSVSWKWPWWRGWTAGGSGEADPGERCNTSAASGELGDGTRMDTSGRASDAILALPRKAPTTEVRGAGARGFRPGQSRRMAMVRGG